ncbi:hypothetical protein MMC34_003559 [Xylographa carneopallida]|nr:hypothetical protein [Xylographa carneopallida]
MLQHDHVAAKNTPPIPPEEVLFKRRGAPQRYHESDFYWANQTLVPIYSLPDSGLVETLHVYSSNFYDQATINGDQTDFRSMDETALLALSILIEESSKHILGENGHLVFVESEEEDQAYKLPDLSTIDHVEWSSMRSTNPAARKSGETRSRKKIKLNATCDEDLQV